ncbi:MAG: hypothetical protein CFE32_06660 [Alphaproteobacteria bacterium PA3]|nr:MAG: hypothetical protein CFE32_06660 [Alphaproteobacteria bacterium PA3]
MSPAFKRWCLHHYTDISTSLRKVNFNSYCARGLAIATALPTTHINAIITQLFHCELVLPSSFRFFASALFLFPLSLLTFGITVKKSQVSSQLPTKI